MKLFRLAIFALLSPIAAQAQQMLTLEDAIQQGITKQYSIQISRQRERIAANENSLGNAGFLPTITGSANKNYTISGLDQSFFGGVFPYSGRGQARVAGCASSLPSCTR